MCEPLKGYSDGIGRYAHVYINSAVKGLIRYHEEKIERKIKTMQDFDRDGTLSSETKWILIAGIKEDYKDINAIELWLEDVI